MTNETHQNSSEKNRCEKRRKERGCQGKNKPTKVTTSKRTESVNLKVMFTLCLLLCDVTHWQMKEKKAVIQRKNNEEIVDIKRERCEQKEFWVLGLNTMTFGCGSVGCKVCKRRGVGSVVEWAEGRVFGLRSEKS